MSDLFTTPPSTGPAGTPAASGGNVPVQSVSEVAQGVKRTIESAFGRVKIRGEISRPNYHRSGHLYLTLKDERAVMDAVAWKGQVAKFGFRAEEGMEVIASGKLTTFPGGSKYQLNIESMEIAGEGALLKMLEDRRKKLAAEGLFAPERKKPLPVLPQSIGVVTSPTGAVIRDILHRLADRFPRDVLLWPVSVQGEAAAGMIATAIRGFNQLPPDGPMRRPDVLIVGRGGGSLEDLWAFNEEVVIRAVADSAIPIISAVGHETDTTLIDYVADVRAPTPTGAAEMAVPVRTDELLKVDDMGQRLNVSFARRLSHLSTQIEGLGRALTQPERLIQERTQGLDLAQIQLERALQKGVEIKRRQYDQIANRLSHPRERLNAMQQSLVAQVERWANLGGQLTRRADVELATLAPARRLREAAHRQLQAKGQDLAALTRVLAGFQSAKEQLQNQGYIYVTSADGGVITRGDQTSDGQAVTLNFIDQAVAASIGLAGSSVAEKPQPATKVSSEPKAKAKRAAKPKAKAKAKPDNQDQGTLL